MEAHHVLQGLSNPAMFVHVERDIRLLVHGDDFTVEMSTREEKWFEGAGKGPFGWQHRDESIVLEPCDQVGSRIW